MIEFLFYVIKDNPVSYGAISFLTGTLFGHWLAIGRDKRKEFNEISRPIRLGLLKQIELLKSGRFANLISHDDFILLGMYFSQWKSNRFKNDLVKYKKAQERENCGHTGSDGSFVIDDLSEYIKMSYKLLSYAQIK